MLLAFIDTETTGLDPHTQEVIEIAIILVDSGKRTLTLHRKIKPERLEVADPYALKVNGYAANPEAWNDALPMSVVGPEIVSFLKGAVLVGHNVSFDREFLVRNLERSGIKTKISHRSIDTITLAFEHLQPLGLESMALDSVRKFLGWSAVGAHTALKDVEDTLRLFELVWGLTFWRKCLLRARLLGLRVAQKFSGGAS
jgi:DNA polymerase III epsilon subunit-like protein